MKPWIGVDLDGTLAEYHGWQGPNHIGKPIAPMVEMIKFWRAGRTEVRIFTARVSHDGTPESREVADQARQAITRWCEQHLGEVLPVTNEKDYGMVELWDDRAVRVQRNQGIPCCGYNS